MPATFGDVYGQLCERWTDPRERGRQFEPLVERVLRTDRIFRERYAAVWRWSEWPGRQSGDIGVDIVAQRLDGGLTAIQCKCYDPDSTLYEQNLATFLAYTNADFDERLIISTTPNWSRNLLALISNQQPPVQRLDLFGLEATTIDWDAYLEDDAAPLAERPRKEVRPHQQRAIDGVFAGFEEHDRGKLIMACGTGKTFTALRVAEEQAGAGGCVIFAAPSISLVAQALREWTADAATPIRAFAVCSDPKVGRGDEDGGARLRLADPGDDRSVSSRQSRCSRRAGPAHRGIQHLPVDGRDPQRRSERLRLTANSRRATGSEVGSTMTFAILNGSWRQPK